MTYLVHFQLRYITFAVLFVDITLYQCIYKDCTFMYLDKFIECQIANCSAVEDKKGHIYLFTF